MLLSLLLIEALQHAKMSKMIDFTDNKVKILLYEVEQNKNDL